MIRLYARVTLAMTIVFAVLWTNYLCVTEPALERASTAHTRDVLVQASAMIADAVSQLPTRASRDAALARSDRPIEGRTPGPYSSRLARRDALALSAADAARLDAGEPVAEIAGGAVTVLRAVAGTDEVLVLGPTAGVPFVPEGVGLQSIVSDLLTLALGVVLIVVPLYRRIAALRATSRRIAQGERSARAVVTGRDALGELADSFNDMAATTETLIETQRELMRAVSHEFRTPIARIRFALEIVGQETDRDEIVAQLASIDDDLSELDELVEEMLTYARLDGDEPDPMRCEPVELSELLPPLVERPPVAGRGAVSIELRCEPLEIAADRVYLTRAVQNLLANAQRYARGRVRVTARVDGDTFELAVEDDGPGIPAHDRERVYASFARLEGSRNRASGGAGLGLAIVAKISEWHGGTATVDDSQLGGARFRLRWPRSQG